MPNSKPLNPANKTNVKNLHSFESELELFIISKCDHIQLRNKISLPASCLHATLFVNKTRLVVVVVSNFTSLLMVCIANILNFLEIKFTLK